MSLSDYITSKLQTPFAWGTHDCVCFAIGWVSIATGKDHLAPWRPWTSEIAAKRLIKKVGGLERMFDKHLKRIPANTAKDGDVALIGDTAFLFSGAQIVGPSKNGLVFINRMEATCAWSY